MKHCYYKDLKITSAPGAKKIVLAGNPNTGKSVFFNFLTGMYADVSNYPGTTLEISHGKFGQDIVIDTPGVYGLSSFNDEERIARDIILGADIVVNIVDAVHLERDLFLTQQIIDTGVPVVVAINMVDEAKKRGLIINYEILSSMLGVPVFPTVATKKLGLEKVKACLYSASRGNITPGLREKVDELKDKVCNQGEALLILEGDEVVANRHGLSPGKNRYEVYMKRRKRVNEIISAAVKKGKPDGFSSVLSHLMIKPLTGIPIMLLAFWIMYYIIGVFIAGDVVAITEEKIMLEWYVPAVKSFLSRYVALETLPGRFLAGDFGLLTMTVTYLFGLLMPLVAGFYLFLSIFEDSGYLPRIAVLTDRLLNSIGLNGRAVIPIILGFGCVTMATIVTRLLGSQRERTIAIFLLGLTIPCSAQLGVITGLLAVLGTPYVILYITVIFCMLVLAGTVLNTALPGKSSDLMIDLPPLRVPIITNVLKKTWTKSYGFIKEALPIFAVGAILITALEVSGALKYFERVLMPLTVGWLELPSEVTTAFIMGIIRRDFGAAGLTSLNLTAAQIMVALITMTLFVPCIASILVLFKERSKKEAAAIWLASLVTAFLVGGIIAKLLNVFTHAVVAALIFLILTLASIGLTTIGIRKKLLPLKSGR